MFNSNVENNIRQVPILMQTWDEGNLRSVKVKTFQRVNNAFFLHISHFTLNFMHHIEKTITINVAQSIVLASSLLSASVLT